jgi:hypothetical protein
MAFDGNLTVTEISKNSLLSISAFSSVDKIADKDSNLALRTSLKWSNLTISPSLFTKLSSKLVCRMLFISRVILMS